MSGFRRKVGRRVFAYGLRGSVALISLAALAACQGAADKVEVRTGQLTSAEVFGFESLAGWTRTQGQVQSLSLSTNRTKGASALALTKPSSTVRIDSANIASTNTEIAKIERGAYAAVDFMLPNEQVSPYWTGAVQMYVSVPSKNMYNAYLGQVDLTGTRTGVYATLRFKFPDATADAIKGATFSDLSFGIVVNVPANSPGIYRLDNLRIKGKKPPAPTDETQITPGQSILLVASKAYSPAASTPASQTFPQGVIQIPASFHAVTGAVGTGSATFEYALDTSPNVVCQYTADTSTGHDYKFVSCPNGAKAGDLVPATFVRLTIVNGDAAAGTTKVRAQIALNPVADDILGGLPPIPTYFGTTAAEVAASLDGFVQAQRNWQVSGFVPLHLPTPAIPVQDSVIVNGSALPPVRSSNTDPQFGVSGRLTGSDIADAGWHANGSIDAPVDNLGARNTSFDLDVGADVFLLGGKTTIVGVTAHAESHTPAPSAGSIPATSASGRFCYSYYTGGETCINKSGLVGLNEPLVNSTLHISLPSITYWIFSVGASIDMSLTANLTGGFTPDGIGVGINPNASVDATLRGGLSAAGFVGAGLFVKANLIGVSVPLNVGVSTTLNLQPGACSVTVTEKLEANAILTAGSGTVGYYVEAGICCGCFFELCWRDEGNLFSWPGYSRTVGIVPATSLGTQTIPLDTATVCPAISSAPGGIDYPIDGETFHAGDASFMKAKFTITYNGSGGSQNLDLDDQVWTSTCPSDQPITNALGHSLVYGDCPHRTLKVVAKNSTHPEAGSGTAMVTVDVANTDQTNASIPAMGSPSFGEGFDVPCSGQLLVSANGHIFSDPDGDALPLKWYSDKMNRLSVDPYGDPGTFLGDGNTPTIDLAKYVDIIRLISEDAAGHKQLVERPIFVADGCPK